VETIAIAIFDIAENFGKICMTGAALVGCVCIIL